MVAKSPKKGGVAQMARRPVSCAIADDKLAPGSAVWECCWKFLYCYVDVEYSYAEKPAAYNMLHDDNNDNNN